MKILLDRGPCNSCVRRGSQVNVEHGDINVESGDINKDLSLHRIFALQLHGTIVLAEFLAPEAALVPNIYASP